VTLNGIRDATCCAMGPSIVRAVASDGDRSTTTLIKTIAHFWHHKKMLDFFWLTPRLFLLESEQVITVRMIYVGVNTTQKLNVTNHFNSLSTCTRNTI